VTLPNPFQNTLYIATGGEDTEILISEVKKTHLCLQKSLNYHTSSIRTLKKLLISCSDECHRYYLASAGSQMVVNLFEVEINKEGFEIIHLTKFEGLKSDQDFRIMDIDFKVNGDSIFIFIASSSGQYHCIKSGKESPKFSLLGELAFDTALLCIKAVENVDGTFTVFSGTNKGKFLTIRQPQKEGKFIKNLLTS
jgi:WD40 repeat protein